MADVNKARVILGWMDCKYQPGKCLTGRGWVCQLNELTEEARGALAKRCAYLLRDEPATCQHEPDSQVTEVCPVCLPKLMGEEEPGEGG